MAPFRVDRSVGSSSAIPVATHVRATAASLTPDTDTAVVTDGAPDMARAGTAAGTAAEFVVRRARDITGKPRQSRQSVSSPALSGAAFVPTSTVEYRAG